MYLRVNPIQWFYTKKSSVFRSSTEAEYRALAIATVEIIWMEPLLHEIKILVTQFLIHWCDN